MNIKPAKVSEERLYQVVEGVLVTEKSTIISEFEKRQYVFKVRKDAAKTEIKQAIELLFDVDVESVSTAVMKGKVKRLGQSLGRRSDWKKAYVALKEGQEINFTGEAGL